MTKAKSKVYKKFLKDRRLTGKRAMAAKYPKSFVGWNAK